ncbi:MAG: hypothetical protein A2428_10075 [Bdellovibrionales bacterium RIFOXYC1_FULL_54_43]|nr:MAG: hypothetical protein A2428_10075 [Bdellovibrionales bacterium RIFOXYC1_FULL_54_43]OFZ80530.1 MAG: hypothetical protein A2603_13170 [Bdellovibrionales bacterium RIFOXYD1_FULL_55_31]
MKNNTPKRRKYRDYLTQDTHGQDALKYLLQQLRLSHQQPESKERLDILGCLAAAEKRTSRNKKMLGQFLFLYKQARRQNMKDLAAVSLLAISEEHEAAGSYFLALKYSSQACAILKSCPESVHRHGAWLSKIRLLNRLMRLEEARAVLSDWQAQLDESGEEPPKEFLVLRGDLECQPQLSDPIRSPGNYSDSLSDRLLNLLREQSRSSYDLIVALWGESIPAELGENRLKNLLGRVRKRYPGLIIRQNGLYCLADEIYLSRTQSRKAG